MLGWQDSSRQEAMKMRVLISARGFAGDCGVGVSEHARESA